MKKAVKNTVQLTPVRPVERRNIFDSLVASFQIEGIHLSDAKVQSIYAKVNQKLKK